MESTTRKRLYLHSQDNSEGNKCVELRPTLLSILSRADFVLSHLPLVGYMQFTSTCTYLHNRHKDSTTEKRRESLVKVMRTYRNDSCDAGDSFGLDCMILRGYKLPNGNLEGLYESIAIYNIRERSVTIKQAIYANGMQQSATIYNVEYIDHSLITRFHNWEPLDLADLYLYNSVITKHNANDSHADNSTFGDFRE